jgi:hypothetical protein
MALRSKQRSAGVIGKVAKRPGAVAVETIEARLERKAAIADGQTAPTESLGRMTREKRHKLLYAD